MARRKTRKARKKGKCVYNPRIKKWVKPLGGRKGFKICRRR
jgi:hypothetical protein